MLPPVGTCNMQTSAELCKSKPHRHRTYMSFFLALSGALIATSIVNLGDSGIPFFFVTFSLLPLAVIFPYSASLHPRLSRNKFKIMLGISIVFLLMLIATFLRVLLNIQSGGSEILHFISRVSFLAYFFICLYFLVGDTLTACLIWLRRILIILALYGIYQLPAKLLGLPLFLDWLRNNRSFAMYDYDSAGWVSLVRATSIFSEPSQAAVPLLVLIFLNKYIRAPRYSRLIGWIAVAGFTLLTFSRTVWLSILALALGRFIASNAFFRNIYQTKKVALATCLLCVALVMPLWAFYGANFNADLSRQERAGSIIMGIQLIEAHPIIGSGWNSYQTLMPQYPILVEDVSPDIDFKTIHNMLISYVEQSGIPGLVLALFPFIVLIFNSHAPLELSLASLLAFLAAAELGGDVGYSSLFWLWIAVLINWDNNSRIIMSS